MTLQQIAYFCAICEEMHFTKAASKVHISQPSLSYAVRELEKELGVDLFNKKTKKVELTDYGEVFYQYAQRTIKSFHDGIEAINKKKSEEKGQIKIGFINSISVDFLAPLIGNYYDFVGNNNCLMNFMPYNSQTIIDAIELKNVDIAFTTDEIEPKIVGTAISMSRVFQQQLYVVVKYNHPLAQKDSVLFKEIKNENYVAINPNMGLRILVDGYFQRQHCYPRVVFSANDSETVLKYIEAGVGIGILPRLSTMNFNNIKLLPVTDYPIYRSVVMLLNERQEYSAEAKRLIQFVRSR